MWSGQQGKFHGAEMTAATGSKKLVGRTALVTGGSAGIGEAVARTLAREGSRVVIASRNLPEAERVAGEIRAAGGEASAVKAEVTRAADVEKAVATAVQAYGPVDILINGVGGFRSRASIVDISEGEWDAIMDLNLKSAFLCIRAVSASMMERRSGRIVNFSTPTAIHPSQADSSIPYACSKAAIIALTKHLAKQLGPYGVTVNTVTPGTTLTPRVKQLWDEEAIALKASTNALRCLVEPQDSADAVLFLVSDESRHVTGINLNVNAGAQFY
jgi:3-oxoacyl-[acyl-carrier protein] reductase